MTFPGTDATDDAYDSNWASRCLSTVAPLSPFAGPVGSLPVPRRTIVSLRITRPLHQSHRFPIVSSSYQGRAPLSTFDTRPAS